VIEILFGIERMTERETPAGVEVRALARRGVARARSNGRQQGGQETGGENAEHGTGCHSERQRRIQLDIAGRVALDSSLRSE